MNLSKINILILLLFFVQGCKHEGQKSTLPREKGEIISIEYAQGFSIVEYDNYKIITLKNPWPDAEISYRYLLAEADAEIPDGLEYDEKINIPVEEIVVTSTTHIPSLEILGEVKSLVGFPGLDYISSKATRKLIDAGKVKELGENQALNTEILLSLQPDVIVGFSVNGNNKAFNIIQENGIPVVYNADWVENSPLGKAEWVKFFGAFYNKLEEATAFFKKVEKEYKRVKKLAKTAKNKPRVLSGAMLQDIWYLPAGESWHAQFIEDANAEYVFSETEGNGSLSLPFERVFAKAKNADFWIGPAQYKTYEQLLNASPHYAQFEAFQNKSIYTYSSQKGETGGVIFYELAPNRPDLVLKDLISIFHPALLPEYETTFYKPLR